MSTVKEKELRNAARYGKLETVRQLLDERVDVNATDDWGRTPLYLASFYGYDAIVKRLLGAGAKLDPVNKDGKTALDTAKKEGHYEVVKMLEAKGLVLVRAARDGNLERVQQVLDEGSVDVDRADNGGKTALMWASCNGHESVVQLLLKRGARVDQSRGQWKRKTALIDAKTNGQASIEKLIQEYMKLGKDNWLKKLKSEEERNISVQNQQPIQRQRQPAPTEIEYTPSVCTPARGPDSASRPCSTDQVMSVRPANISLPQGPIGVTFHGCPPRVASIEDESPVQGQLRIGQYPVGLNTRVVQLSGFPDPTLLDMYLFRYESCHRVLVVSDFPPTVPLQSDHQTLIFRVMIPPGSVGIRFGLNRHGRNLCPPMVETIRDDSPIKDYIEVGLILKSIVIPGEGELSTLDMETANVLATLERTRQQSGRVLVFYKQKQTNNTQSIDLPESPGLQAGTVSDVDSELESNASGTEVSEGPLTHPASPEQDNHTRPDEAATPVQESPPRCQTLGRSLLEPTVSHSDVTPSEGTCSPDVASISQTRRPDSAPTPQPHNSTVIPEAIAARASLVQDAPMAVATPLDVPLLVQRTNERKLSSLERKRDRLFQNAMMAHKLGKDDSEIYEEIRKVQTEIEELYDLIDNI